MFMNNQKGFSLVQVLIAAGMMAALSVVFMQQTNTMTNYQIHSKAVMDEMEMLAEVKEVLNDKVACSLSLINANTSPSQIYEKERIDGIDSSGNLDITEGMPIDLWKKSYNATTGTYEKGRKILNGEDESISEGSLSYTTVTPSTQDKSRFGQVIVKRLLFIAGHGLADPPTGPVPYTDNTTVPTEEKIRIIYEKPTGVKKQVQTIVKDIYVDLTVSTDSDGKSEITGCGSSSSSYSDDNLGYPDSCTLTLQNIDAVVHSAQLNLDISTPGFSGIFMRGTVKGDDQFKISGTCTSGGNELSDYFSNCTIGMGQRDHTNTYNYSYMVPPTTPGRRSISQINGTPSTLIPDGEVNEDDTLYIAMSCPEGSNPELNQYVKNTCSICLGNSDYHGRSPDHVTCARIATDPTPGNIPTNAWAPLSITGGVKQDDVFFLGFFCNNEYAPFVKEIITR